MDVTDEHIAAVRRMWTFRAFVWGLRFMLAGFLLIVPAYFVPRWFGPGALVLVAGGIVLGIPFRVLAFWRIDIPYTGLFMLGLHDALPAFLRHKPAIHIRNPAGLYQDQRTGLLQSAAPKPISERPAAQVPAASTPTDHRLAAGRDDKLTEVRATGTYRLSVWGYRIMLVSLLSCCGAPFVAEARGWMVTLPIAGFFGGFLLTIPLRMDSSLRLWLAPGRIMGQALRDAVNPTFY